MHKPYQTVHVFSPKSEKHEAFFLLFVCPHGFLQYSLLCLLSVACESLILYISQNLFIKRPSVSLATS